MRKETKKKLIVYIIAIIVPLAIGGLSALVTGEDMKIYSELKTPPLSPPSILFPIVWSILYILMGVGSALVILNKNADKNAADSGISVYIISLALNFVWSILFFSQRLFLLSFIWLLFLLGSIILTIVKYKKVSDTAAYLQIPYAVWVAFAGYLNLGIWILNK